MERFCLAGTVKVYSIVLPLLKLINSNETYRVTLYLFQVHHLQKVLMKKRDPVTHVCFIDELAKAKVLKELFVCCRLVTLSLWVIKSYDPVCFICDL